MSGIKNTINFYNYRRRAGHRPQMDHAASAASMNAMDSSGEPAGTLSFVPNRPASSMRAVLNVAIVPSNNQIKATPAPHDRLNHRISGLSRMRSKKGNANISPNTSTHATSTATPWPPGNPYFSISGINSSKLNNWPRAMTVNTPAYTHATVRTISERGGCAGSATTSFISH